MLSMGRKGSLVFLCFCRSNLQRSDWRLPTVQGREDMQKWPKLANLIPYSLNLINDYLYISAINHAQKR